MKKNNFFKAFVLMIPKFARVSPVLFVVFNIVCFLHGIARAALVPATQFFLERASDFTIQKVTLSDVIIGLILLGLAHICRQLLHGVHHIIMMMYWRRTEGVLSLEIHKKLSKISPIHFEDTQTLDDMNKAIQGKDEAVWFTGSTVTAISFYIPYFTFMAVYLMNIKPILIILLALVFAPTLLAHIFRTRVYAKAEDKAAPIRREFDYYELCLTGREYFKETRILGAFIYFKKLYTDSLAWLNKLDFRASAKASIIELCVKLLSLFGYIGILLLLFDLLMKGEISVGAFAAIFTSLEMVFSLMREMIVDNLGESAKNLSRVQNYLRFLQMPEREGVDTEIPIDVDIKLAGVSFSYPGAKRKAIDDITLILKNGETIAVVGENGSGKTTLVRLITGLYLPNEGDVFYGDINTKTASTLSIFKRISAVFQKYQRYQMILRENIGISDVNEIKNDNELDRICVQAGIDKADNSFNNGYDTMLSREFDGIDLSGGQWQRVAIARSFFRTHEFIVLDEPTAAIDPIEETKLYNRFAEISKDRTAIIVTHRLGSVKLADRILVMKQGKLIEQGTHTDLMALNGEYTRLYKSQEQWYKT
ncbi:MAG: hypothetical protein K0S76_1069 [Herbinix sp.]|jgi:ATP-binding cassette subfamily B protein|nr:hypothetical protein [Herbinix sp.]